ncbi:MAG: protein phosphatase 2C domain-containing protein [Gammaproteobacteria bacterium]|nr:protein phosphatase 2C domain-containing protein [Gammaproteobacteria bacterium]
MNFETGEVSLIGNREENQDRSCVVMSENEILLAVADGMGGHLGGEAAAQAAIDTFTKGFKEHRPNSQNAEEFLRKYIINAHREVVKLGKRKRVDDRPRTTIVACVIADGIARWAHVGDTRLYLFHSGKRILRTRDHSAVETLFQSGRITEEEMLTHPMRNFVEQCLGGEAQKPEMTVSEPRELQPDDILLACSDGFWAPLKEKNIAKDLCDEQPTEEVLEKLAEKAAKTAAPHSDNVTAVALRWLSDDD